MKPVFVMGIATLSLMAYLLVRGDLPVQRASAQGPSYERLVETASRVFGGVPRSLDQNQGTSEIKEPASHVEAQVEVTSPLAATAQADAAVAAAGKTASPSSDSPENQARELSTRATRLLDASKYGEAREVAEQCLRLESGNLSCEKSLINSYVLAGDYEQAAGAIGNCLERHPDDPFCQAQRSKLAEANPVAVHDVDSEPANEERP